MSQKLNNLFPSQPSREVMIITSGGVVKIIWILSCEDLVSVCPFVYASHLNTLSQGF